MQHSDYRILGHDRLRSRLWAIAVVALLLTSALPAASESHEADSGLYLSAGGGGALATPIRGANADSYFGFVGRVAGGYRLDDVRFGAEGSYKSFTIQSEKVGDIEVSRRASIVGVMATAWYDIPTGSTLGPYVGGGLGVLIETATLTVGSRSDSNTESKFGAQAGLGVNVGLSDELDLQFGYRVTALLTDLFGDDPTGLYHTGEIGVLYRL